MFLDKDSVRQPTNRYHLPELLIHRWLNHRFCNLHSFLDPGLDVHDFAESMLDAKAKVTWNPKVSGLYIDDFSFFKGVFVFLGGAMR